jgi:hypothetical protein
MASLTYLDQQREQWADERTHVVNVCVVNEVPVVFVIDVGHCSGLEQLSEAKDVNSMVHRVDAQEDL